MKKKTIKRIKRGRNTPTTSPNVSQFRPCADSVAALLSAFARRKTPSRLGGDWLHVSALLAGDCQRAYLLSNQEGIRSDVRPRAADRLLWAIGKTVEAHIRESLIELHGAINVLGRWKCACGKSEYVGRGTEDEPCPHCHTRHTVYDEINLRDEETRLTGSPDCVVWDTETKQWTVIEIKSIKVVPKNGVRTAAPDFHNLNTPTRSHVLQALLYRWLLIRLGYPVSDTVNVIYGAKDYMMQSPYKVFAPSGEAEENVLAVTNLVGVASEYGEAVRTKGMLPRIPQCNKPTSNRAKQCACVVSCFNRRT